MEIEARQAERANYRNPTSIVITAGHGLSHSADLRSLSYCALANNRHRSQSALNCLRWFDPDTAQELQSAAYTHAWRTVVFFQKSLTVIRAAHLFWCVMPSLSPIAVAHLLTIILVATTSVRADELCKSYEPITATVTLVDDSTVRAVVDAETDDQFLAIRSSAPGIFIRRFIPWHHIAAADIGEQVLTSDALKKYLKNSKLDGGDQTLADLSHSLTMTSDVRADHLVGATHPTVAAAAGLPMLSDPIRTRVTSLEFSATAANWDRDAAFDGVRVLVRPLNAVGEVVPADGYITLRLFGQKFLPAGSVRHNRQVDVFPTLENWTRKVRNQDFGLQGAVYQFAYRRTNPLFVDNLSSIGLTHASLSVPGQGVFRASDDMTVIRDFSPFRNQHEQLTGQRFLPVENVP